MRKAIVAIGGGDIGKRATADIDREIIRLSNTRRPKVLFIPTASSDSEDYCQRFAEYFGKFLRCEIDVLRLVEQRPPLREIERKIFGANIVYVGGGNTLFMMRRWRRLGVDGVLRSAYERGIVLAGVSAGAICWFESGHSDSMSFYDSRNWKYINVRGLGLVKGVYCPHYNAGTGGVPRRRDFQQMIGRTGGMGIGVENHCAIEFVDGRFYRVLHSKPNARAYRVRRHSGRVVSEQIPRGDRLEPIERLYEFA